MDWVKLSSKYYNDPAVMRAGEAAEVLFTRALAFCGDQETEGFIPAEMLSRLTPSKAAARAAALVREGLWDQVDGGFRFTSWEKHQVSADVLGASREANRNRQSRHRERKRAARNGVTNALVTGTEVEEEVDAAAAALGVTPEAGPLPMPLEILKSKLEARKLVVRWDKLSGDQLEQMLELVELHGDGPLVHASLKSFRPDAPPSFAQAWLAAWAALPVPGLSLQLAPDPCLKPGHEGTTRRCIGCITEGRAAN